MVKMLQSDGRFDLAKKIFSDLRQVLKGLKDPIETAEEHYELTIPFLSEDDKILVKLRNLTILSDQEMLDVNAIDDDADSVNDENVDMLVSLDDSNLSAKFECACMKFEDALVRHCLVGQQLRSEVHSLQHFKLISQQKISVLEEDKRSLQDDISKHITSETEYKKQIDELRSNMMNTTISSSQSLFELSKQVDDMKLSITLKNSTIEDLQSQIDSLSKAFEASIAKNESLQT
jgi:hypothetical protein